MDGLDGQERAEVGIPIKNLVGAAAEGVPLLGFGGHASAHAGAPASVPAAWLPHVQPDAHTLACALDTETEIRAPASLVSLPSVSHDSPSAATIPGRGGAAPVSVLITAQPGVHDIAPLAVPESACPAAGLERAMCRKGISANHTQCRERDPSLALDPSTVTPNRRPGPGPNLMLVPVPPAATAAGALPQGPSPGLSPVNVSMPSNRGRLLSPTSRAAAAADAPAWAEDALPPQAGEPAMRRGYDDFGPSRYELHRTVNRWVQPHTRLHPRYTSTDRPLDHAQSQHTVTAHSHST